MDKVFDEEELTEEYISKNNVSLKQIGESNLFTIEEETMDSDDDETRGSTS